MALIVVSEVRASEARELAEGPTEGSVSAETLKEAGSFAGEWRHVGGDRDREAIDAAIATSMEAVSPVLRGIGTKRLNETNQIAPVIEIGLDGESVSISQGGESYSASLDGAAIRGKSKDGDKVKVTHVLRSSKLVQTIKGDGGMRVNRYKLSSDGKRLTLSVEISSSHLPVPVTYSLSYERR